MPCSGPTTTEVVFGPIRVPFASVVPRAEGTEIDWNGGVLAIYENATTSGNFVDSKISSSSPPPSVILAVIKDLANHLTIVDSDGMSGGTDKAVEYFSRFLDFEEVGILSLPHLFFFLLLSY